MLIHCYHFLHTPTLLMHHGILGGHFDLISKQFILVLLGQTLQLQHKSTPHTFMKTSTQHLDPKRTLGLSGSLLRIRSSHPLFGGPGRRPTLSPNWTGGWWGLGLVGALQGTGGERQAGEVQHPTTHHWHEQEQQG